jgi:hypothetical protein
MESATWMLLTAAAVVVLAIVVAAAVVLTGRRRVERELGASRAELDALRTRVEELSTKVADRGVVEPSTSSGQRKPEQPRAHEFVITSMPDGTLAASTAHEDDEPSRQLSAGQFASVALGESLVRLLSLGYGVGRALSPENRNRIRFAMRQEVRRSKRQRRHDVKAARRHLRAQQAEAHGEGEAADLRSDAA